MREILAAGEKKLTAPRDLVFLAESALDQLGDRQWAGRLYQKAEAAVRVDAQMSELILSIDNRYNDPRWAERLRRKR
jgi:hypothetical protein